MEKDPKLFTEFMQASIEELEKLLSPAVNNTGKKPMKINNILKELKASSTANE
jgi:hypothetical protein